MKTYEIVIASTNRGKVKEISKSLNDVNLEGVSINIGSLEEYKIQEPVEVHESFMENAILKAKYYANIIKEATLSEDSGLCIQALKGFPGVRTKDLIEESGGILNAFRKLENSLVWLDNNKAYFNCAVALYIPSHDFLITHEVKNYGTITFPPRGHNGFGFDPIFVPDKYDKTYAELGPDIKNKISHRAKAMTKIVEKLEEFLKAKVLTDKESTAMQ